MPFMTAAIIASSATALTASGAAAAIGGITAVGTGFAATGLGITAATIAADAALVAGGVSAFSQFQAGQEAEALGKSQNEIAQYNAILDLREAEERLSVAGVKEQRFRTQAERLKARQRVGFAKAGVELVGTPMDTLEETAIQLETEALGIRRSGQIGARSLTASAQLRRVAGRNALTRGRQRKKASQFAAIGTAIGSVGRSASLRNQLEN